jgi:serine/threonine protein phosphatase PrpC
MRTSAGPASIQGLAAAAGTNPGRQREQNEDRYHLDAAAGIFLVVDGVGGEAAGEVAAQIAVQTILNRLARQDGLAEVRVREAITLANRDILRQARERPERTGMACVLTLGVLEGRQLTIGHVGDSRLYKLTPQGIAKLTHDHSPIGEREDSREISETEAMQHARRNEVYRDVGSVPREPDDPGFVETAFTDLQEDSAILLCSDGLSDMLTSLEIERIARAHAGDPHGVVAALITAANDAGGKDNITVVFAQGPRFTRNGTPAGLARPPAPVPQVSTTPLSELVDTAPTETHAPESEKKLGLMRRIVQSRVLALVLGTVIGLVATVALLFYVPNPLRDSPASRRLVVGSSAVGAYQSIAEALAQARSGDVVSVEPGEYAESLLLADGVDLVARVPGKAVLVAPPKVAPGGQSDWIPLTARSGHGLVRGFRIEGRANAPMHVGIRVINGDLEIDDVTFEGAMSAGVEIGGRGSAVTLRSSRFNIIGLPVRVADTSAPTIRQNVFVAGADRRTPAVDVEPGASPRLEGNVFVYFPQVISPPGRRDALLDGNFVIGARR